MKLAVKERYFFGNNFESLLMALAKFTRDVYDDVKKIQTEILTSLPTASEDYRGRFVIVPVAGVDKVYVCRKNGSLYEWKEVSLI